MKQEDRDIAMNPARFRKAGSANFVDIRTLDETDEEVFNSVYYKEVPVVTGNLDETLIVTYSPKYKAYQQKSQGTTDRACREDHQLPLKKTKG